MRLRTFTAANMPAAINMVRETLGDDAIIISSKEILNGTRGISVTAAADSDHRPVMNGHKKENANILPLTTHHSSLSTDSLRFDIQNILRFHNLPELYIAKLMQKASDPLLASALALHRISGDKNLRQLHRLALEKIMATFFEFAPLPLDDTRIKLMLVGVPGAGKTLTIAKMAARMSMEGQKLTVITTDNKRAGGVEQLEAFTRIMGIELKVATSKDELVKHLKNAHARALIDTAGCNPYDRQECAELKEYASLPEIEPVLAVPAGGDASEAMDIVETFAALPIKRLLITRADTARRFGGILAAAATHGLALSNTSHSSSITDALPVVDAAMLGKLLLRYQLNSSL